MAVINPTYLANIEVKVDAVVTNATTKVNSIEPSKTACAKLVGLTSTVLAELDEYTQFVLVYLNDLLAKATINVSTLGALNIDLSGADIGDIINWIKLFITTNITKPYTDALELQAELVIQIAKLTAFFSSKLSELNALFASAKTRLGCP